MSTLLYRWMDSEGRREYGSGSFASDNELRALLNKRGFADCEIFESRTSYSKRLFRLVSPKELSIFCKQMSVMIYSHMTLMEGVTVLADQTDNKQMKIALDEINDFMGKGSTFAEAICMYRHIFTPTLLNMIVIGETSGTLDSVFDYMSDYFDKEGKTRKKIKAAVLYPSFLAALMAAVIVVLIAKILPMFSEILQAMGAQVPDATEAILSAGSFLAVFGPVAVVVILFSAVVFTYYIHTEKGARWYDKAKFSIPAYRYVTSRVITARFARSLSILLKSGIQLLNAFSEIATLLDNKYIEEKLLYASEKLKDGCDTSDVLSDINVFPALFQKMFVIGLKSGNMDEMLDKAASVFDDEVDDALERFTALLEPILIIILSVIVGVILLSVILPMVTIMNSIG